MELIWLDEIDQQGVCEGETHLHCSRTSCTSVFISPNRTGLLGIAPHLHEECDDIEILIRGEIGIFRPWREALTVRAPALIVSPPKHVHGFYVSGPSGARVLGLRTPMSYQGQSFLDPSKLHEAARHISMVPNVYDLTSPPAQDIRTSNCHISVQQLPVGVTRLPAVAGERILFFLGRGVVLLSKRQVEMPAESFVVLQDEGRVDVRLSNAAIIVDLRPLQ